jgi:hypothetical protein
LRKGQRPSITTRWWHRAIGPGSPFIANKVIADGRKKKEVKKERKKERKKGRKVRRKERRMEGTYKMAIQKVTTEDATVRRTNSHLYTHTTH